MFKRFMLFVLLFVLILAAVPASAQFETPLIVAYNGQLWALQLDVSSIVPFETCPITVEEPLVSHYDGALALSPDGTMLAYNVQPAFVTEAIERSGGIGGGELPSNIVLCNLETGAVTTIAGQPENAAFFDEAGNPDVNAMHSLPTWSPDGSQLAWTQFSFPDVDDGGLAVMVYDLASGETTRVAEVPPQFGVPVTIPLDWSEAGILVRNQTFVPPTEGADPMTSVPPVNDTLQVLDPTTGTFQTIYTFTYEGMDAPYPQDYFWVETNEGWQVALLNSINEWQIINPQTGSAVPLDGVLTYGIPDSRTTALISQDFGGIYYQWVNLTTPDGQAIGYETNGRLVPPAISQDAVAYAYSVPGGGSVIIWREGDQTYVPLPALENVFSDVQMVWGGGAIWQMLPYSDVPGMSLFYPTLPLDLLATGCPGFMPSQLIVNQVGTVVDGQANNVRSAPTTSGDLLGQIPPGGNFMVLAGPVCAEDMAWWRVSYNDLVGWTAEGMGGEYWLAPLAAG
jgi:hypothetical protein